MDSPHIPEAGELAAVPTRIVWPSTVSIRIIPPRRESHCPFGKYQGTQLDGLSAGDTIRVNGYIPCLTELFKAYHCSLSTFHHGRSINLAAANAETVEIGVLL